MKRLIVLLMMILAVILFSVPAEAVPEEYALVSGTAVTSNCFMTNRSKTLTLTNAGTSTYTIAEDDGPTLITKTVTDNTRKFHADHPFKSIKVTESGGSAVTMTLRCY